MTEYETLAIAASETANAISSAGLKLAAEANAHAAAGIAEMARANEIAARANEIAETGLPWNSDTGLIAIGGVAAVILVLVIQGRREKKQNDAIHGALLAIQGIMQGGSGKSENVTAHSVGRAVASPGYPNPPVGADDRGHAETHAPHRVIEEDEQPLPVSTRWLGLAWIAMRDRCAFLERWRPRKRPASAQFTP